ncbi:MAG: Lytic transglycosylase catalytic [Thermoleophilia bacterium]|nr:Lytic transglycosylase catalytic [Thermoleophilia bacterium]
MAFAALLAAGIPGVAGGNEASGEWMDLRLRTQLRLDEVVIVGTGGAGEDRDLVREVQQGKVDALVRPEGPGDAAAAHVTTRIDFRALALREARRAGIRRPILFVRQIAAESGMQPCATSGAGAIGIAQIMPGTARGWGVDPWIPEDALRAAAQHMARYERQLGSYRLALAAYNAGPGAVQQFGGMPPYAETREYVRRISDLSYPLPGMRQVFTPPRQYSAGFRVRLGALMLDVRRHGGKLAVEEGWRSYDESLRIWKVAKQRRGGWERATKWAAPPGCSNHTRGLAADLLGSKHSIQLAHDLAGRHGLVFPMGHEPWHVERAGIETQSG